MQGLTAPSNHKLVLVVFLLGLAAAEGQRRLVSSSSLDSPCKEMTLYFHDILYNGANNSANATSAPVTKPTALSTTHWSNGTFFGMMAVFDDPVTQGKALPGDGEEEEGAPAVARAQGLYLYDGKEEYKVWMAMSLVFDSGKYKGTMELMGADLMGQETRDISVVGGTGDFLMARGVATLRTDATEGLFYFRLQMDIKLYQCYV